MRLDRGLCLKLGGVTLDQAALLGEPLLAGLLLGLDWTSLLGGLPLPCLSTWWISLALLSDLSGTSLDSSAWGLLDEYSICNSVDWSEDSVSLWLSGARSVVSGLESS